MIIGRLLKRDPAPEDPVYLQFEKRNPFSDFWDYMRQKRPHRWPALVLAITIGVVGIWALNRYLVRPVIEPPTITYFNNFDNRSDADIRRDWVGRLKSSNQANAKRRANYQKMADELGIDYDAAKADADTEAILNARYDEFIATGRLDTLPKEVIAPPKVSPLPAPENPAKTK